MAVSYPKTKVIFPALFELVITHIWHRNFDDDICTNGWCSSAKWESQKLLQKNIHICKDIQKVFLLFLHLYFYTNSWCFSVQQYLSLKRYSTIISCVFSVLHACIISMRVTMCISYVCFTAMCNSIMR